MKKFKIKLTGESWPNLFDFNGSNFAIGNEIEVELSAIKFPSGFVATIDEAGFSIDFMDDNSSSRNIPSIRDILGQDLKVIEFK